MRYAKLIFPLLIAYLALTQNLQLSNLVVGMLACTTIAVLMQPSAATLPMKNWPHAALALSKHILLVMIDTVKCGIAVAKIILDPKLPLKPGMIAVPAQSTNSAIIALSAHAITITPGEQVLAISDSGTLYTHCLNVESSSQTAHMAQQARLNLLKQIFGD